MLGYLKIFRSIDYPSNVKGAEKLCSMTGIDTLIYISKFGNIMGRGKKGVWILGIPNDISTIYLTIRYELLNKRNAVFYSNDLKYDVKILNYINSKMDSNSKLEFKFFENSKFLCHSTDINSFINILDEGRILSFNSLSKKRIPVNTLRFSLKEPNDYLDYVDLCDWNSLSSERVLASREKKSINMDDDTEYIPAIRIYFETEKLYELNLLINDGIHFKVENNLPIKYASHFVINNRNAFEELLKQKNIDLKEKYYEKIIYIKPKMNWTLKSFVNTANIYVSRNV